MKKSQFKGYILEHVLAYLLQSSGYSIIDKLSPNEPDVTEEGNGLNISGRGAKHQIDVIGNLDWIPAFTFPTRLLVEAKFRDKNSSNKGRVGIDIVREQIGILSDINENYFSAISGDPKQRYRYVSAIFSANGFSKDAVDLAIAHQIQLVDMSDDSFSEILNAINTFTDNIFGNRKSITSKQVSTIRENLIKSFFENYNVVEIENTYINTLKASIDSFRNKIFIGMSQSGFMLLLHDSSGTFLDYAKEQQMHDVTIHWSKVDGGKQWIIKPLYGNDYKLTFKLPQRLHDWIYKTSEDMFTTAINEKERHFSKISIYHKDSVGNPKIFTLKFNKENLNY